MNKKSHHFYNKAIVNALLKLPNPLYDKKHDLRIFINNGKARSNESRFEHIANYKHELKVSDIDIIRNGINDYITFTKSKKLKDTYFYYIRRKGKNKGFIQVTILIDLYNKKIGYLKNIFIAYKLK